ncbi:23S rRNA (uracil(1939)-C(5))-methyltransferase RlmD [Aeromonas schubertii]
MSSVGEQCRIQILELTDKGDGVGRAEGIPVYVEGALPGEEVEIALTLVKPNYMHGRLEQVVTASPDRVPDFCPHTECGGCQVRPLAYPAQLEAKRELVRAALTRQGLTTAVAPVLGMTDPFAWRNKAQFAVRAGAEGAEIGFYRKHSHTLVACDDCAVQDPLHGELLARLRRWMREHQVRPYDEANHEGDLRHVMTRKGFASGEWMLVLVTRTETLPAEAELLAALEGLPITTLVHNIHAEPGNRVLGPSNRVLSGEGIITDRLHDLEFVISPLSFYQVNPMQTDTLYGKALEFAALTGSETVFDLYCGIGTISLFLARQAARVIGIELVPEAIEDARRNAERNGIGHAEFHVGKAEEKVAELYRAGERADVVVVDPPRKGCDKALLETLVAMAPERLVYVSCNPQSLARDLAWLTARGFVLEAVQPVDMFPHTLHVEAVARLRRA